MAQPPLLRGILCGLLFLSAATASAQEQPGTLRGLVYDNDRDVPLSNVDVVLVEIRQKTTTTPRGNYSFPSVPAGEYTVVFSREGYVRQVADVVIAKGDFRELNAWLDGDFTEMEEFVVQDFLPLGSTGSELALLDLRIESPALLDSIGADQISRAGASDAAGALRLVAGATVKDGKSAVIRGLPDRYVSSQLNGVRLPSADQDKRAVELDQFPSAVIESLQVSKTFTPDQQGDASGGAVDVRLRGVPEGPVFSLKTQISANSQVTGRRDFLSYSGGGVNTFGRDDGGRDAQFGNLGGNWDGAAGVSTEQAPLDHKWNLSAGGRKEFENFTVGAFASVFYERDSSFYDNGVNDSYWVEQPGDPLTPETIQGTPTDGDFRTALFDITQGSQLVQLGGLLTLGLESENHEFVVSFLNSRTTEDTATLAIDTRGKAYYFPGYDPDDLNDPGNDSDNRTAAPYIRTETLDYTERETSSLQFRGAHTIPFEGLGKKGLLRFLEPELEWSYARSGADLDQPDKRQFGAAWLPPSRDPGAPPFIPPFDLPPTWFGFKPAANFTLGNFQRIYTSITEDSDQYSLNLRLPFEQWSEERGYFKFGLFDDGVDRRFDQDNYSNFGDNSTYEGDFDEPWSEEFPFENHPITESLFDVDYRGEQDITAWYSMLDLPLFPTVKATGGFRIEKTEIGIKNTPEEFATWFPSGATAPVKLNPGDADVNFAEREILPSFALQFEPVPEITFRGAYSETLARQTFKELTPILQQEFLGGPIFIGNPELQQSKLRNYDLRVDVTPVRGTFLSASYFIKKIKDPIEYVQRPLAFTFTSPVNYPKGRIRGQEFEIRQDLGLFGEALSGLQVGANATYLDSLVRLPEDEIAGFELPQIDAPIYSREMTDAPDYIYNFFVTYDIAATRTQVSVFYTQQGDTLLAGAGQSNGNLVPSIYAKKNDSLNLVVTQRLGEWVSLTLQAKNLTNPRIEQVYRSEYTGADVRRTSFTRGIDYSLGMAVGLRF